ncbi:hypothetical protein D3C72_2530580 [compost metagenome]
MNIVTNFNGITDRINMWHIRLQSIINNDMSSCAQSYTAIYQERSIWGHTYRENNQIGGQNMTIR